MNKMIQGTVDQIIGLGFTSRSGSRNSYHFEVSWAILFHAKLYYRVVLHHNQGPGILIFLERSGQYCFTLSYIIGLFYITIRVQ